MPSTLSEVVPWGRSYDEYVSMFALSGVDLSKRILGAGDGPASFNGRLARQGGDVMSIDPLYQFTSDQIVSRIRQVYPTVMEQARVNQGSYVWSTIPSLEALGATRMAAMEAFLDDYARADSRGRYLAAALPGLSFLAGSFDLALCSHFLFLYSHHLSLDFHLHAILELCRVAREVRVFPLLDLGGAPSGHVPPVMDRLAERGYGAQIQRVPYEFQRGGNQMLRITSPE